MPIPPELLSAYLQTRILLPDGAPASPGPLAVQPAAEVDRAPLPLGLRPEAWFVSAESPANRETTEAEDAALRSALRNSLKQANVATLPARAEGPGVSLEGLVLLGVDRARAVTLGYKRKQWAVWGLFEDHVEVVYTGVNSRES